MLPRRIASARDQERHSGLLAKEYETPAHGLRLERGLVTSLRPRSTMDSVDDILALIEKGD